MRGYADRYNHEGFYVLIGRQGAQCGNINIADGKAYFTEHAVAVQANDTNDTGFLAYLLSELNLGQFSGQSAQPGLAVGVLKEVKAFVPVKGEQHLIGTFFRDLDDLIALHQRKPIQQKSSLFCPTLAVVVDHDAQEHPKREEYFYSLLMSSICIERLPAFVEPFNPSVNASAEHENGGSRRTREDDISGKRSLACRGAE